MLLNKTDLLKEGELEQLQAIVASLNPFATVSAAPTIQQRDSEHMYASLPEHMHKQPSIGLTDACKLGPLCLLSAQKACALLYVHPSARHNMRLAADALIEAPLRAQVVPCQQGVVPLEEVFGKGARSLVANLNIEGQHRGVVAAARAQVRPPPLLFHLAPFS